MVKEEIEKTEKAEIDRIEELKAEMEKGLMTKPTLSVPEYAKCRNLVTQYYEIQEIRKGMNSAKKMIERDYKEEYPEFDTEPQERIIKHIEQLEEEIKSELTSHVETLRIYAWLRGIEGIGPIISIGLISALQYPGKFDNPSKMHRNCGLAPVDWCKKCDKRYVDPKEKESWAYAEAETIEKRKAKSKQDVDGKQKAILKLLCDCDDPEVIQVAEKKRKGLPIHYNPFLKTLMWKIGSLGFIMHKGYYRDHYDNYRAFEDKHYPDLTDGHRLGKARRKTVKLFIQHFWNAWRRANGMSIETPYVMKAGGHHYIPPPHEDIIRYLEWEWKQTHKEQKKTKKSNKSE